jgi:hypothetical protein
MKLLRLTLVLLWTCFAQPPTAPPSPNQSGQTTSPGAGNNTYEAFLQAGNREQSTASPDFDVAAIQRKGMIKADHKKNLADAAALLKLAEELKSELEKEDPLVISVKNIKRTEDIQKLAKDIHGRLKRY